MSDAPSIPSLFTFHHLGYASRDLDKDVAPLFALGYRPESPDFEDPIQGVRGRFLVGPGPRIELLVNLPGRSTLDPFLDAGARLYHLAYEVPDLDAALAWARSERARVVSGPSPAVAFDMRPIAFVMFRTGLLVELVAQATSS